MVAASDAGEEGHDFLQAGNPREHLRLLGGSGDGFGDVPVLLQSDVVEEGSGGNGDGDQVGHELLIDGEEPLVVVDSLRAEPFRRLSEMAGEARHLADVARLGVRGQAASLHIFRHAAAKGCHWESPLRNRAGCAAMGNRPMLP